jgi:NADH-quinone oxidoreductase subunit C
MAFTLDDIKERILKAIPGAELVLVPNEPPNPASFLVGKADALEVARFLRDAPELKFDYCSNVTGVDFLDATLKEKIKVKP